MKRYFKAISILFALSMLAGCGTAAVDNNSASSDGVQHPSSEASSDISSSDTSENISSLVVYFSWSGNTQQMAE